MTDQTSEQFKRLIEKISVLTKRELSDYVRDREIKCPVCEGGKFSTFGDSHHPGRPIMVAPRLVASLNEENIATFHKEHMFPLYPIVCDGCGHALFFNAERVARTFMDKPEAEPESEPEQREAQPGLWRLFKQWLSKNTDS